VPRGGPFPDPKGPVEGRVAHAQNVSKTGKQSSQTTFTLQEAAMAAWSDLPDEIWGLIFTQAITCHTPSGYQTALEPACCLQTTCRRFRDVVTSSCCSAVWEKLRLDSTSATDNMPVIISVAHLVKDMDLLYDTLDKAPFTEFFKRLWASSAGNCHVRLVTWFSCLSDGKNLHM